MSGESCFDRRIQRAALYHQHYLEVVRQMMFVNGDSEVCLSVYSYYLLISYDEWFVILLTSQTASSLRQLSSIEQQSIADVKEGSSDSSDDQDDLKYASKRISLSHYDMIASAVNSLDGDFTSIELEADFPDHVLDARQRRMAARVSVLDPSQYDRFSDARKATFQPSVKKGSKRDSEDLLVWLGSPPAVRGIEFIIGFLARETVAQLVYDALTIREQEPVGWFADGGSPGCIQMRHYEEAVRRNLGFRYRGDYLFGYF
uniref:RGS domain-containing protein n=1 Tax=Heterorhabditis bacteriophora TaxID=37862 RepID=A0A1I7XG06_HETBA